MRWLAGIVFLTYLSLSSTFSLGAGGETTNTNTTVDKQNTTTLNSSQVKRELGKELHVPQATATTNLPTNSTANTTASPIQKRETTPEEAKHSANTTDVKNTTDASKTKRQTAEVPTHSAEVAAHSAGHKGCCNSSTNATSQLQKRHAKDDDVKLPNPLNLTEVKNTTDTSKSKREISEHHSKHACCNTNAVNRVQKRQAISEEVKNSVVLNKKEASGSDSNSTEASKNTTEPARVKRQLADAPRMPKQPKENNATAPRDVKKAESVEISGVAKRNVKHKHNHSRHGNHIKSKREAHKDGKDIQTVPEGANTSPAGAGEFKVTLHFYPNGSLSSQDTKVRSNKEDVHLDKHQNSASDSSKAVGVKTKRSPVKRSCDHCKTSDCGSKKDKRST